MKRKSKEETKTPNKKQLVLSHSGDESEILVGIDEVGRGPLFGRIYVACVVLPNILDIPNDIAIRDSKQIKKKQDREKSAEFIKCKAVEYAIEYVDMDEINQKSETTTLDDLIQAAFHKCLSKLKTLFNLIIVDGKVFRPYKNIKHITAPKADDTYMSVAAASILAKVERDNYIHDLIKKYPVLEERYHLSTNVGYGTAAHMDGLKKYGYTEYHRGWYGIGKGKQKVAIKDLYTFSKVE